MKKNNVNLIVGLFVIGGMAAMAYLSVTIAGISGYSSDNYRLTAKFDNSSGLKEGAFIGIGTSIKQSTTIGKKVTVGGHSYVNKNCSPNSIYYGAPIKKIIK